jgi:cell division protein ZapA
VSENINLTVLDLDVAFKPGADMARVRTAACLLEERYDDLRARGGQSREALLIYLALGLADDVVQLRNELGDVRSRVKTLLSRIENVDENRR